MWLMISDLHVVMPSVIYSRGQRLDPTWPWWEPRWVCWMWATQIMLLMHCWRDSIDRRIGWLSRRQWLYFDSQAIACTASRRWRMWWCTCWDVQLRNSKSNWKYIIMTKWYTNLNTELNTIIIRYNWCSTYKCDEDDMPPAFAWPTMLRAANCCCAGWLVFCWFHAFAAACKLLRFVRSLTVKEEVVTDVGFGAERTPWTSPFAVKFCGPVLLCGLWFKLLSSPPFVNDVTNEWMLLLLLLLATAAEVEVVRGPL